jgi:hypothetical protein
MNYFNPSNVQLAYEAVYNQDLCESMEDLGLIDDYNELEEGYKKLPVDKMMRQIGRKSMKAGLKLGNLGYTHHRDEAAMEHKAMKQANKMARVASRHSQIKGKGKIRGEGQAELNRRRGEMKEEVDLYDIILEYLIQEGYADTLGSAEIILENMSEEWIESILDEETAAYRRKNWQPLTPQRKERIKRQMAGAYNADQKAQGERNQKEANRQWRRGLSMTFQTKMPRG